MAKTIGNWGSPNETNAGNIGGGGGVGSTIAALAKLGGEAIQTRVNESLQKESIAAAAAAAKAMAENREGEYIAELKKKDDDTGLFSGWDSVGTLAAKQTIAISRTRDDITNILADQELGNLTDSQVQDRVFQISNRFEDGDIKQLSINEIMQAMPKVQETHMRARIPAVQKQVQGAHMDTLVSAYDAVKVAEKTGVADPGAEQTLTWGKNNRFLGMSTDAHNANLAKLTGHMVMQGDVEGAKDYVTALATRDPQLGVAANQVFLQAFGIQAENVVNSAAGRQGALEYIGSFNALASGTSPLLDKSPEGLQATLLEREQHEVAVLGYSPNYGPGERASMMKAYYAGHLARDNALRAGRSKIDKAALEKAATTALAQQIAAGSSPTTAREYVSRVFGVDLSEKDATRAYDGNMAEMAKGFLNQDATAEAREASLNKFVAVAALNSARSKGETMISGSANELVMPFLNAALKGQPSPQARVLLDKIFSNTAPALQIGILSGIMGDKAAMELATMYQDLGSDFGGTPTKDGKLDMSATTTYLTHKSLIPQAVTQERHAEIVKEVRSAVWPGVLERFYKQYQPSKEESEQLLQAVIPFIAAVTKAGLINQEVAAMAALTNMRKLGYVDTGVGVTQPSPGARRANKTKAMPNVNDELSVAHGIPGGFESRVFREGFNTAVVEQMAKNYPDYPRDQVSWYTPKYDGEVMILTGVAGDGVKPVTIRVPLARAAELTNKPSEQKALLSRVNKVDKEKAAERLRAIGWIPQLRNGIPDPRIQQSPGDLPLFRGPMNEQE